MRTIGIIGNPNSGKTTVFNALTGAKQHIGNWPGVTVEKKEGVVRLSEDKNATLVDLPGIYSLKATSEDEKAALGFLHSCEADLFINIIDATALERNLYLTMLLCELKVPMMVVVTMMDVARARRIKLDLDRLAAHLGIPVVGIDANSKKDIARLRAALARALVAAKVPRIQIDFPNNLGDMPEVALAETRYKAIEKICSDVVRNQAKRATATDAIDRLVLNRFLGIPVFLGVMYLVFWLTQNVGSVFIEFFDVAGETLFVGGSRWLLVLAHAPDWIIALISSGVGSALQTVGTFIPPIFFMFLSLALLEDSGYMARAAFVVDRLMRFLGLPGKSFVPMLVGFGCSVPAIMATRTLESKRDRFLTVFMIPFMSCSAKLPIWALFAAAFFPHNPGLLIFSLYVAGIVLAILTGLLLKQTLFQGEPTPFIMELPPYHLPRTRQIFLRTWERIKVFIFRAGKLIVPLVLVLGLLNTFGTDGSIGNQDTEKSVLAAVGKAITPVFEPIGIERGNWPASVAIFTGLFAKESVVGTMNGLYGQAEKSEASEDVPYSFRNGMSAAVSALGDGFKELGGKLLDPLGTQEELSGLSENAEGTARVCESLRRHFPKGIHQMMSYLLFLLLYVPCLAATGVVFREIGKGYGCVFVGYLTVLGWSVATMYHAVMVTHSAAWFATGAGLVAAMFFGLYLYGRKHRVNMI